MIITLVVYLLSALGVWLFNHYEIRSTKASTILLCVTPVVNTAAVMTAAVFLGGNKLSIWLHSLDWEDITKSFFKLNN